MLLNLENRMSHCQNLPIFTQTFHFHFATRFLLCCAAQHNAAQRQQLQKHRAGTTTPYICSSYLIQVCLAYLVHLEQIVLNTWAERYNVYTMHFQYSLSNLNKNLFHLLPYLPLSFQILKHFLERLQNIAFGHVKRKEGIANAHLYNTLIYEMLSKQNFTTFTTY